MLFFSASACKVSPATAWMAVRFPVEAFARMTTGLEIPV